MTCSRSAAEIAALATNSAETNVSCLVSRFAVAAVVVAVELVVAVAVAAAVDANRVVVVG